jgi:GTP pyrophosphokinase
VPLTHRLSNGDRVEIIATSEGGPSLDWLNPARGFIASARARAKVRQWFNSQNHEQSVAQGRAVLEREAHRVGVPMPPLDALAVTLGHARAEDLFAAIGRGEIGQRTLQTALRGRPQTADVAPPPLPPAFSDVPAPTGRGGGILVVGMDRLLTQLARCCHPLPPEPIVGFVTRGKGVSIHRQDCPNVRQLPEERRLEACWGPTRGEARFQADVEVAGEGGGLLRSAVDALARERFPVRAARTAGRGAAERVRLSVEVADDAQLQRVLAVLQALPGVASTRRC